MEGWGGCADMGVRLAVVVDEGSRIVGRGGASEGGRGKRLEKTGWRIYHMTSIIINGYYARASL
eukprot:748043-Hanusia_phi.AAC.7